jgi:hypothetical protein
MHRSGGKMSCEKVYSLFDTKIDISFSKPIGVDH